jgi:dTDP-4-amino-4,6-dideoxygalactose transaminase
VTFIAPVNAVRYAGATPVFFDCDEFYNIDVSLVARFLHAEAEKKGGMTINRRTGRRIAAIIPVHVFGNAVRLEELVQHCRESGIAIIEDATESLGTRYATGTYAGRHAGTVGKVGCLSFNGNKIITTGGGGMILTEDGDLALKARYLTTQAKDDHVRYVHNEVGYNFRLTNVQAAMGVAQLERLDEHLRIKERNYRQYQEGIAGIPGLSLGSVPPYARNNRWMYALRLDRNRFWTDRDGLMAHLAARGVETRPVWMLNHLQRPYRDCQYVGAENASRSLESTLNIPCSVNLTDDDVRYVLQGLRND